MPENTIDKLQLFTFGRSFLLMFNRTTMYDVSHPYCQQAIDQVMPSLLNILKTHSPLVFIMNQDQLFVEEDPVDPRINMSKMIAYLKKTEVQSISFYNGIDRNELAAFMEIFNALKKQSNVNIMKKEMAEKDIQHIRLNHVYFKKVSGDEEVVSREAFKKIMTEAEEDGDSRSRKIFMDAILEGVLAEEFGQNLTVRNLIDNPAEVSDRMIDADLRGFQQSDAADRCHGPVLAHQLDILEGEIEKNLSGLGEAELSALSEAVFDMKRQLLKGIERQKSLGIDYSNENALLDKANDIADRVILKLIKDEYKSGKISTSRLAQILKRLVPDPNELKRLLPKIKNALLEEGMPLSDYLKMVEDLSNEFQDEELSKILQQGAESVGLYGQDLIMELKNNPVQAAEIIFLAAEIRKAGGDENIFTDLLVEYVEKISSMLTLDMAKNNKVDGETHLRQVMDSVESQILGRLKKMDVKEDILQRIEEKLNKRYDELFDVIKAKWDQAYSPKPGQREYAPELSVLQLLEQSASESEELANILHFVRSEVQDKGISENDFQSIMEELTKQYERRKKGKTRRYISEETLDADGLVFFLNKEISRASRYDLPFAALSFAVVTAKPKIKSPEGAITQEKIIEEVMKRFATNIRGSDFAAKPGKNRIVGIFPMTTPDEARLALKRHLRFINTKPFDINGVPVAVQVAGVVTNFDVKRTPDTSVFLEILYTDLSEMVNRIKNIHGIV
ncbi:MAG: hypothetical protein JW944_08330 [Deltaproteobacteria bacterium]|nr:hypothetical protein [Deltaproteobacteria bacterium]